MKKFMLFSLTLCLLTFLGCSKNEKEDILPKLEASSAEANAPVVDVNSPDFVSDRSSAPCAFSCQYTTTGNVIICGDFDSGCSFISCTVCGLSKGGRNLSAPSGNNIWFSGGEYTVSNRNAFSVTFRIRRSGTSTWATYVIPALGEIYLEAIQVSGTWFIGTDFTPPC